MAFCTEALPTHLCENHKRAEQNLQSDGCNRRIWNKERYESLSS